MRKIVFVSLMLLILLSFPSQGLAQDAYYFQLPQFTVNVFYNADGSQTIDYLYYFKNEPNGHAIDYVDIAYPKNVSVDFGSIQADVSGKPIYDFSEADYLGSGSGVAVGLGSYTIQPGKSGRVHVYIGRVTRVLYDDSEDNAYASARFAPAYFEPDIISSAKTDLSVTYHLPPGVLPEEPKWHSAPAGFPSEPETGFDNEDNITYTWRNQNANPSTQYEFGASFPKKYVPEDAIVRVTFASIINDLFIGLVGMVSACAGPLLFIGFFVGIIVWSVYSTNKRKLQYLPPKIAIEGHGIKRGLTAVEAAVLMEQALDKIMTMTLFSAIKKNAVRVATRDPLELEVAEPLPEELNQYEKDFIAAFRVERGPKRRRELQSMMVALVRSLSEKMRGFSRRETVDYYRSIIKKAWEQVEAAQTPEVKSQKYDESMEWTMLDGDFDNRTRRTFSGGPVFVPIWWGNYDPVFRQRGGSTPLGSPRPASTGIPSLGTPMPNLPGSDFAASVVNSVQSFAGGVIGNVSDFTSTITQKTNPVPVSTSSSRSGGSRSGGGGRSCACACACAGCACACAGGGR